MEKVGTPISSLFGEISSPAGEAFSCPGAFSFRPEKFGAAREDSFYSRNADRSKKFAFSRMSVRDESGTERRFSPFLRWICVRVGGFIPAFCVSRAVLPGVAIALVPRRRAVVQASQLLHARPLVVVQRVTVLVHSYRGGSVTENPGERDHVHALLQ